MVEVSPNELEDFKNSQANLITTFDTNDPRVSVKIGSTDQTTDVSKNDFFNPVVYTVSTPDEQKDYDVVLRSGPIHYIHPSRFRDILAQDAPDAIDRGWLRTDHTSLTLMPFMSIEGLNIPSVYGVQFLTNLEALFAADNPLSEIDLSGNSALFVLDVRNNQLTEIDLSANTAMEDLRLNGNQLTKVDIRGMRQVTVLEIDACTDGANPLTELLVHENIKDNAEIKEAKDNCGSSLTIKTYSGTGPSKADYTLVESDYTPSP